MAVDALLDTIRSQSLFLKEYKWKPLPVNKVTSMAATSLQSKVAGHYITDDVIGEHTFLKE